MDGIMPAPPKERGCPLKHLQRTVIVYANLKVSVEGEGETHYAHSVVVTPTQTVIYLDAQDGGGSYPIENGQIRVPREKSVTIDPCF